ncbi:MULTISPECIES: response regulator [Paenibacillus]|jgi:CitB family two-component system response regulator MalR|uniref:Transcriptional regulatory protein n=1 Tax=Paenibacillus polymyxa TaxID=1406 RepID=A0A8I1J2M4_PAEPO|nr:MULTISPECIES: response regulator [Paenibacillus]KAF6575672.1 response regulator [Paenibacillus sp. EKM206P]KAF6589304.1 response regulator [Paenibacillus sp. EKM205P]MBM0634489.1 response regulator [Paenibacillus polymyxa]MBP1307645.1 CitB family two-component system response regulator MalR [Paenibacillus sp. 1182]UMY54771.1 response regulator [Paenibacillus peoriae]
MKVLIVEDDPMVAELNQQFIERMDNLDVVCKADTVKKAQDCLQKWSPDLVLLDVYLPGKSGLTLLSHMQEHQYHASVILITAAKDIQTVKEAVFYGVADYLIKPFTFERFRLAVEKIQRLATVMEEGNGINQAVIDHYFNKEEHTGVEKKKPVEHPPHNVSKNLSKNLSKLTMTTILKSIQELDGPFSVETLAREVDLSRITVKKYIQFLVDDGFLVESIEYHKVGRPLMLYQLNPDIKEPPFPL